MSAGDNSGPAFPVAENHRVADDIAWTCGMTLRDYFAAKAMSAFCSFQDSEGRSTMGRPTDIASSAYEQADAMLAERAK